MKETRFKDTEIGIIPEDWEVVKLEDKGSLLRGSLNPQMFPQKHFVEYSMPSFDNGCIPEVKEGITMQSGRTCIKSPVLLYNKLNVRQKIFQTRLMLAIFKRFLAKKMASRLMSRCQFQIRFICDYLWLESSCLIIIRASLIFGLLSARNCAISSFLLQ